MKEQEMAVLQEQVAGGVAGRINLRYLGVAVLALAVGVGATLGVNSLIGSDDPSPAQIASVRWDEYADMAQNRWIAQVNATDGDDLVAFYRSSFLARAGEIQAQRAQDMVDFRYGSGT
jgi:hypothetical protein